MPIKAGTEVVTELPIKPGTEVVTELPIKAGTEVVTEMHIKGGTEVVTGSLFWSCNRGLPIIKAGSWSCKAVVKLQKLRLVLKL